RPARVLAALSAAVQLHLWGALVPLHAALGEGPLLFPRPPPPPRREPPEGRRPRVGALGPEPPLHGRRRGRAAPPRLRPLQGADPRLQLRRRRDGPRDLRPRLPPAVRRRPGRAPPRRSEGARRPPDRPRRLLPAGAPAHPLA